MEEYHLCLSNGWSIEHLKNVDKDIELEEIKTILPFAQYEFYEGKIRWIFDPFHIKEECIETCEKIELFKKEVHFTVMKLEDKWEKKDEFNGTFIDALEYIKKEL